jgi:hypothetical protein
MKGARKPAIAAAAVLLGAFALASPAAAQDVATQFWPEIDTFVRVNDDMRIYVPISNTKEGLGNSSQNGTVGLYFDYYFAPIWKLWYRRSPDASRARRLLFRVGYGYTAPNAGEPATSTVEAEVTGKLLLPWDVLALDRNRFDLNFTGPEFDPRYRNRLRFEREVDFEKAALIPYLYGEFFYSFNRGDWIRTRAAAGLEFHVWKRFVPEVYFQRDHNRGSNADVNGFGLVFSIYLR